MLLFGLVVGFFALKLYHMQIVETGGSTDNTSTFTTLVRVKAARGDILDRDGNVLDTLSVTLAVPTQAEYDAFADPGDLLLTSLCSHSGGSVTDDTEALVNIPADSINVVNDFRTVFGIIIAIALLADIAIRKLSWRDIKNLFLILKNR
jgi:cell division protein FtsI/penicillin-binding protein 2